MILDNPDCSIFTLISVFGKPVQVSESRGSGLFCLEGSFECLCFRLDLVPLFTFHNLILVRHQHFVDTNQKMDGEWHQSVEVLLQRLGDESQIRQKLHSRHAN